MPLFSIHRSFMLLRDVTFRYVMLCYAPQCNTAYFPWQERESLARTIIRKHDHEYSYHCNVQHCGKLCEFSIVTCPNEECDIMFNQKHSQSHDTLCPQKVIPCDRLCGETMKRCSVDNHKEHSCPLR